MFENTGEEINYHNTGWSSPAMSWFSLSAIAEKAKVIDWVCCLVCVVHLSLPVLPR